MRLTLKMLKVGSHKNTRLAWSVCVILLPALVSCSPTSRPSLDADSTASSAAVITPEVPSTNTPQGDNAPFTVETPAIVIEPPVPQPTATPIPASVGVPVDELALLKPGVGSLVRNPIQVEGFGGPSQNNRVQIRLYGEDGRLISQGYTFLYSYPGRPGQFFGTVPFNTPLVAETGWLEVRSFGDRYGLLRHLTKIQINLLSTGNEKIYPAIHGAEKLTIFSPREDARVSGGSIQLSGAGWVDAEVPLGVELLDAKGQVLATTSVAVDAPGIGQLGIFSIALPYEVSFGQWGRVGVFERHGDVPGVIHYTSVQVWLEP
jgi:hypothetical protein